ncbi:MAG: hypothetical protein WAU39_21580 [Polyangiales bacterium]
MGDDLALIVHNQATWVSAWTQDSYQAVGMQEAPPIVYQPVGVALLGTLKAWLGVTSPIPYRVLAVLLHTLAAALLALWLRGLGLATARSLTAASLWSVMPIHAEAMYWASGLLDIMASCALLGALVLAIRPSRRARVGAVGIWVLSFLLDEALIFGSIALLLTMAYAPAESEHDDDQASRPPLGMPAVVGALALAAWWTARSLAGVQIPESVPLHWSALGASFGEAIVRAVGLGEEFRAGGAPLHGMTLVAAIALAATAWYAWQASREPAHVMLPVLSLSVIAGAQVLFGQSEVGFIVDPDRYFYLAVSFIPVTAVCAWNPPAERSTRAAVFAVVSIGVLLVVWAWSDIEAQADYESFDAMLTREIRIGRASAKVYLLRGLERMKHDDPCAAEMDFRFSFAMATETEDRDRARMLGIDALQACSDTRAAAIKAKRGEP